jgi:acetylornithine deacetylase/succinyl-diaminopimelate desuccinylase-like protein
VTDPEDWLYPPHAAVLENGKLFGRGAVDDKAGLAMMLLLAEVFAADPPEAELLFASVIEDEDSGNGTLACTESGFWCDHAVVLDGTWPDRVIDAHLGQLWLRCRVRGTAAPSCSWSRADNPIDRGIQVLQLLRGWVEEQNRAQPRWLELENPFFLSTGEFHAGNWPGASPAEARFTVQLGFPTPWTPDQVLAEVAALLPPEVSWQVGELCTPPYMQRPNAMAARLASLRPQLKIQAVTGHCDLRHLRTESGEPADACLYGPGGGGNAHVANEFYLVEHFVPVAETLLGALESLLET